VQDRPQGDWIGFGFQRADWSFTISDVEFSSTYDQDGTAFASWASGTGIGGAVHRTTDGGASWESVFSTDYIGDVAISPAYAADGTVFAAGHTPRVISSTDGGESWQTVGEWPQGVYAGTTQVALPTTYPADCTVFAGGQGFWRLPCGQTSWQLADGLDDATYVSQIAVSPDYGRDSTLLAAAYWYLEPAGRHQYGVFRSVDGGATWAEASVGLPKGVEVRGVAFSPRYVFDRFAYATTEHQLYRSCDGGATWTAVGAPAGDLDLREVAASSEAVAVATDEGVWHYRAQAYDVMVNGGFEGRDGWDLPDTPRDAAFTRELAHSGAWSVRVGSVNTATVTAVAYSSARQVVTLPVDALTATLSAQLFPVSGATGGVVASPLAGLPAGRAALDGDAQYVLVLSADGGQVLEILDWMLSNAQRWQSHTYDLSHYAGQTVMLHFGVVNDGVGGQSGLYVDDVALVVERPPLTLRAVYLPLLLREGP
jgi:photosystem II stability/assembly factor-like uncharacterized protein